MSDSASWPHHYTVFFPCSLLPDPPTALVMHWFKIWSFKCLYWKFLSWILPDYVSLLQGNAYWMILLLIIEHSLLFCYRIATTVVQWKQKKAQEKSAKDAKASLRQQGKASPYLCSQGVAGTELAQGCCRVRSLEVLKPRCDCSVSRPGRLQDCRICEP